jgi:hypothetical protein
VTAGRRACLRFGFRGQRDDCSRSGKHAIQRMTQLWLLGCALEPTLLSIVVDINIISKYRGINATLVHSIILPETTQDDTAEGPECASDIK